MIATYSKMFWFFLKKQTMVTTVSHLEPIMKIFQIQTLSNITCVPLITTRDTGLDAAFFIEILAYDWYLQVANVRQNSPEQQCILLYTLCIIVGIMGTRHNAHFGVIQKVFVFVDASMFFNKTMPILISV